ncbi:MAG: diacylglycerol kinase family protein [Acidobacteriota bacterium]
MTEDGTGQTLVLLNVAAGGGRAGRIWRSLERHPHGGGVELLTPGSVRETRALLADRLTDSDVDRLVAIGGDGTAHLAVDALLRAGRGDDVAFGLVPAGTGSDFARGVGLPKRPADAFALALGHGSGRQGPRPVDVVEIETDDGHRRFCLNIASAGLSGAVDEAVDEARLRGGGSYLAATVATLLRYGAVPYRVEVDGAAVHDGDLFLVAMANGRYFGRGMRVAPDAEVDDGLLDVVIVPPIPKWQMPWRLPAFLSGRHVRWPEVKTFRGREIRLVPGQSHVRGSGSPPFDLDGETHPAAPATFRVLPGALRLQG